MDEMVAGTNFHRIGWLYSCVAVHDPTPISVILGFTLAHIAQCHGSKEPPLAIEHKNKALQLIKQRMEDPVEALSDGTIGAVVNIAGYEVCFVCLVLRISAFVGRDWWRGRFVLCGVFFLG